MMQVKDKLSVITYFMNDNQAEIIPTKGYARIFANDPGSASKAD